MHHSVHPFPERAFHDVLTGNEAYAEHFHDEGLSGIARQGLAIVTCIDSRIDPLAIVGMKPGDVKIIRNAGARVTSDVLRTLVLASHLLGVDRVLVMPHTDCKMASGSEDEIHKAILEASGIDTRSLEIKTVDNVDEALRADLVRLRAFRYLPENLVAAGAIFDVRTGRLARVDA